MHVLAQEHKELEEVNSRLKLKLSDKDKEMRLNKLKMSELKRLQRHRTIRPMKNPSKELETPGDETPMETEHTPIQQSAPPQKPPPKEDYDLGQSKLTQDQPVENINDNPDDFEFVNKNDNPEV